MSDTNETLLTATDILNADDIVIEIVDVPEWKGKVAVRSIEGYERDLYETAFLNGRVGKKLTLDNLRARLVAMAVCDKDGKKLFTETQVKALGKKSAVALDRVFTVAQRLSGLTQADIKELEKNLEATQSESSGSS